MTLSDIIRYNCGQRHGQQQIAAISPPFVSLTGQHPFASCYVGDVIPPALNPQLEETKLLELEQSIIHELRKNLTNQLLKRETGEAEATIILQRC